MEIDGEGAIAVDAVGDAVAVDDGAGGDDVVVVGAADG